MVPLSQSVFSFPLQCSYESLLMLGKSSQKRRSSSVFSVQCLIEFLEYLNTGTFLYIRKYKQIGVAVIYDTFKKMSIK